MIDNNINIDNGEFENLKIISNKNNELIVSYEKNKLEIEKIINFLVSRGVRITDISTDDADLEDVFVKLTKN